MLHAVPKNMVPAYFKDPKRFRTFKLGLRKLAHPIWRARDTAAAGREHVGTHPEDTPGMVSQEDKSDAETLTQKKD